MSFGKVLVVDGDGAIRAAVRGMLTTAGYEVIDAEDGQEGAEKARSDGSRFLLNSIVCDLHIPKAGGMEAIRYFRTQFPSCPVIVLAGEWTAEKVSLLFEEAIIEFLPKPVEKELLLAAVAKAVDRGGDREHAAA